jgi:hypothetical protein
MLAVPPTSVTVSALQSSGDSVADTPDDIDIDIDD